MLDVWPYLADVSTVHDDAGSVVFTHLNLHDRSDLRHHDRHRDVEAVAMVGERQSVVAGTGRYDALPLLFLQAYVHNTHYVLKRAPINRQKIFNQIMLLYACLLYTSDAADE